MATYEAYCVKCRAKREFEGEETTLKHGFLHVGDGIADAGRGIAHDVYFYVGGQETLQFLRDAAHSVHHCDGVLALRLDLPILHGHARHLLHQILGGRVAIDLDRAGPEFGGVALLDRG